MKWNRLPWRANRRPKRNLPQETSRNPTPPNPPSPAITDPGPSESHQIPSFPDGVKILHDCSDATVDVCFVHGLTGNRESTWTARGQSAPWPQTLLPSKLNRARILTYGYDAYMVRKGVSGLNRLIDHATNLLNDLTTDRSSSNASSRPLIFVVHSLGGLVCKKAILLSRNNPEAHLHDIFNCTRGIAFMGTPHKGSRIADWVHIPADAIGFFKSTNKSLLEILEKDNQLLESIQVDFWSMVRGLREDGRRFEITCFFEELPVIRDLKVVSKDSATLEGYTSFSIHANHRDMAKFASADENGFKRLLGELARWVAQPSYPRASQTEELPRSWSSAKADQGTSVIQYHGLKPTQDCQKSLAFPKMEDRSHDIDSALAGTCKWLLQHEMYKEWVAHDRGLLWIKGKPGAGKSTLLKYALKSSTKLETMPLFSHSSSMAVVTNSNELLLASSDPSFIRPLGKPPTHYKISSTSL
ncbi:Protein SERAC1 [Madurella mycetomatis]|uniref:Protein SERAC1 n=1 Tax=Madurella mycetomatis TaxID=100816 RepID=A0A175VPE8_9PEZI|nr:Protein SERAC1 [Madurella mycetomatis]